MGEAAESATAVEARVETWFVDRGLPHFIEGYSASRDVLTRAVPALAVLFLAEVVANAPSRDYPLWQDALAIGAALAFVAGVWALDNRLHGRPLFAVPTRVGPLELAVFVLGPALVPLVFGGQWRSALVTAGVNLGLVGGIYLVTSYGVVPMTRWAIARTLRQGATVLGLYVRSMPLLLLFVSFLFLTNEVWQVCAGLVGPFYWLVLAFFPLVGVLFAAMRLPREIGRLAEHASWDDECAQVRDTPAAALVEHLAPPSEARRQLSTRQWGNVGLVVLFSQGVQVVLVAAMVCGVLVAFGLVATTEPIIAGFLGREPHVLAHVELWGRAMVITEELLRVAGFLAVFSGFYFTIAVLTEQTYREEFLDDVITEVGRALAVRAVYLGYLESRVPGGPLGPAAPGGPSTTLPST